MKNNNENYFQITSSLKKYLFNLTVVYLDRKLKNS